MAAALITPSPNASRVLPALLLSLLLHGVVYSLWPNLHEAAPRPIVVQGELVVPKTEEPPPVNEPQPPEPPPPLIREMSIRSKPEAASPVPKPSPDTGVALPVLAEKVPVSDPGDYVVAEVPPLKPDDKLPFASKVGTTSLEKYTPPTGPEVEGDDVGAAGNVEDPVDHDVLAEYGNSLRERAAQFGSYPAPAQKRGWRGKVKVLIRYARSGLAYQITVKDSSGHKILDEQALEMVKQACKDHALPAALTSKAFSVVVPIDFKLK